MAKAGNVLPFNSQAAMKAGAIDGKQTEWRIEGERGLILVCQPSGTASWWFYYSVQLGEVRKLRKVKLGARDAMSLHEARTEADKLRSETGQGADPVGEGHERRQAMTLQALCEKRLAEDTKIAKSTRASYEDSLKRNVYPVIGSMPVSEVTQEAVRSTLDKVMKRGVARQADIAKSAIGSTFRWAMKRGIVKVNPTAGLGNRAELVERDRVLSDKELPVFLAKLDDPQAPLSEQGRIIIKLLLLTGQRRSEVAGVRKTELALDARTPTWTLPGDTTVRGKIVEGRTKNGKEHVVHLSGQAVGLFRRALELAPEKCDFLFPADPSSSKLGSGPTRLPHIHPETVTRVMTRFTEFASIEGLTLHDLRRTMVTFLGGMGVRPDTLRQIINHMPARIDTLNRVYNRAIMSDDIRRAMQLWANHLDMVRAGKLDLQAGSNIVAFGAVAS